MTASLDPHQLPLEVGDDEVRRLERHVAVHAPTLDRRRSARREERTALRLMTRQAPSRDLLRITLRTMHVVTGDARHLRGLVTSAPLEQRDLVGVHVDGLVRRARDEVEVVLETPAGDVRKGRCARISRSAMTLGARVHCSVATQSGRVHDTGAAADVSEERALARDVLLAGPVAPFARDADDRAIGPIPIVELEVGYGLYPRRVAFQAARRNASIEARAGFDPRSTRTSDPSVERRPVRDGKLHQAIARPVEKALPLSPRSRDERNALGAAGRVRARAGDETLIEASRVRIHAEVHVGALDTEHVLTGAEAPDERIARGGPHGEAVGRSLEARLLPVTREAGLVSDSVARADRLGPASPRASRSDYKRGRRAEAHHREHGEPQMGRHRDEPELTSRPGWHRDGVAPMGEFRSFTSDGKRVLTCHRR